MFPTDQLHQLLRHTCSDHKRETISFGRRLESILGRAHLMAVGANTVAGLFPERIDASNSDLKLYRKQWTTQLPELRLKHAA